jgi:hypothetical protein
VHISRVRWSSRSSGCFDARRARWDRGNTAIVLPQQWITGEHVSFPHYILPALQAQQHRPAHYGMQYRAFQHGKRCSVRRHGLADPRSTPPNNPSLFSLTVADIIRIDNQNGGRGCRASELICSKYEGRTDIQVIDNGSGMCKAGFAGDDAPRAVFP